jgi:hypothetical protein
VAKKLNALERGVILDHLQRAGIIDILKHSKAAIDRYLKELPSDRPRDRMHDIRSFLKAAASKGGKARAKSVSKSKRVSQAKKAARTRWSKRRSV